MPLPRRDAVHRYFQYDPSNKNSKCVLCGNYMKGKHTTNLKNHMAIKHPEEFVQLININKENNVPQPTSFKETCNSEKVKNMCLRLVTTHGRPFAMLQDAAFQEIINLAVPSNAKTKHINLNVIKGMIPEKAYQIKSKIGSEVRNIMVSLKLDSATYLDRNFLGINLQYIQSGKIIVRNLAVLELMERQTGDFLKEKLLEILNEFMISTAQIYSITTDNGSNFKKMTRLFTEHCCEAQHAEGIIDEENNDENDENDENEENEAHISSNDAHDSLNVDDIVDVMSSEQFKPRGMLCAAHTLQLAVKDVVSESVEVQVVIQTARQIVKILRRPNMKNVLRSRNLRKPIIDCPTRWTSTYQMLVRLNSLRSICDTSEFTSIYSTDFWTQMANVIACLKPVNDATLALQREQLTISDFYIEWINCRNKVEAIRNSFAGGFASAMKRREGNLINTDLVLENLYLDGRLNVMLSEQECIKAKSLLSQTFRQLQTITSSEAETSTNASSSQNDVENASSTEISELEKMLLETEAMRRLPNRTSLINSFEESLGKLRFEPRVPLHENILVHWNKGKTEAPLHKLASCVLAAPATQVSVERLFSSVKFILNPLRSNISGGLLKDIMLIRSNHDLFE